MKILIEQTATTEETTYKVEIVEPKNAHPLMDRIHKAVMNLQESVFVQTTAQEMRAKADSDLMDRIHTESEKINPVKSQVTVVPVIIAIAQFKEVPEGIVTLQMEFATTFSFATTNVNDPVMQNLYRALNVKELPKDLKKIIGKELHAVIVADNGLLLIKDFTK